MNGGPNEELGLRCLIELTGDRPIGSVTGVPGGGDFTRPSATQCR